MGGRALLQYDIITERKSTQDFNFISGVIQDKLKESVGLESSIVKCYHNKETHGDLDLLLKIDSNFSKKNINLKDYIQETFNPRAIHNNGGVFSFDVHNFQVDFIPINESDWETANTYYSYDPIGNLMGKTFHKFNLSYGWNGLYYKFRNFNGRLSQNILISKDARKIFTFGGYNYKRYLQGFDELEEIFEFIINSKFFNSKTFQLENLTQIDRKRNRKRKSYSQFLNYLKQRKVTWDNFTFDDDKDVYIEYINNYFPESHLIDNLNILKEKDEINKKLSEKFNGYLIMDWIPINGKELGVAIKEFKLYLGEDYKKFILENTIDDIKQVFIKFYNEYQK